MNASGHEVDRLLLIENDAQLRLPAGGGLVKICGLRRPEDARAAAEAGADLLSFIFAPARRQIAAALARKCILEARGNQDGMRKPLAVGVFVDAAADEINATADDAGLDVVQLHGDEAPDMLARLNRPVIKALRPRPGTSVEALLALVSGYEGTANPPVAYVIDGFSPTMTGGAAVRADWSLVRDLAARRRIILAGGLDPDNVGEAIRVCAPFGVDVSSGVERNGLKDANRIRAFVRSARSAFHAVRDGDVDDPASLAGEAAGGMGDAYVAPTTGRLPAS